MLNATSLPTISVITPSYNQASYLDETIRSVLCQRDQIHEYFVFDGGSTDESVSVIKKYASKIDHWVSEKDKGQSDAIHKGFTRATGDILYWLNSDDVLLPGALARVRQAFADHPDWDVLTSYGCWIDADSRIIKVFRMGRESDRQARGGCMHVCQQTCFFKRELYERVGGLDLKLHCVMDTELWVRMFKAGSVWGLVPQYLAGFRRHDLSKGLSWGKEYAAEGRWAAEQYPDYYSMTSRWRPMRLGHIVNQLVSGRRLRAWLDERRWTGRKLTDVFGEWKVDQV
ncbi:MAG: glycosyltransferase family 2 protein [Phycisphaerales bacterium]